MKNIFILFFYGMFEHLIENYIISFMEIKDHIFVVMLASVLAFFAHHAYKKIETKIK